MAFKAVGGLVGVATTLDVAQGAGKHRGRQLAIRARQAAAAQAQDVQMQ